MVFFLFPQPRQPGSGLGLEGAAAGFDYVVLVSALKMPNDLPDFLKLLFVMILKV